MSDENLPSLLSPAVVAKMPLGLALMFHDATAARIERMAQRLAKSQGFVPPHLLGKIDACVAVIVRSITWNLDPWQVANSIYEAAPGKIGYEGKLIHAALEGSGRFEGAPMWEDFGPWANIENRWEEAVGSTGKKYAKRAWSMKDAVGIGTTLYWKLKGELEPRSHRMLITQCTPLNSTLWATDPRTQLKYRCMRAFSNVVVPQILMGISFEEEAERMVDVTGPQGPRLPRREDFIDAETGPMTGHAPGSASDAEDRSPGPSAGGRETATGASPDPAAPAVADRYEEAYALGQRAREAERRLEDGMPARWIKARDSFAPEIEGYTQGWTDRDHELAPQSFPKSTVQEQPGGVSNPASAAEPPVSSPAPAAVGPDPRWMDGFRRGEREAREDYSRNALPAEWKVAGRELERDGWLAGWDAQATPMQADR